MVDERALAIAFTWLADGVPPKTKAGPLLEAFRKAIEAYEAAKPDPWRPIEEAPRHTWFEIAWPGIGGEWLHHIVKSHVALSGSIGWIDQNDTWILTRRDSVKVGAMFRTIDPPTQDAAQGAGDARQEAREDKSGAS